MQTRLMLSFLPGMCHKYDNEGKNSENVLSQEVVIRFCIKMDHIKVLFDEHRYVE